MDDTNTAAGHDDQLADSGAAGLRQHAFDLSGELDQVRSTEGWRQGQHSARTLLKAADLRLVLIAMHEGNRIEEHRAPGPISIHTLSGHIRVTAADHATDLPAGHVLTLERDAPHAVDALADSAFLLTIAWPADVGARR
jgi:quercetin dioxygenase-like cupin family protein